MGGGVEAPDTSLVRRGQWKERRRGEGGVETPDTSLVRRNQRTGERGRKRGGVETPDASLVRGNQMKKEKGRGRQQEERKGGREVEQPDTSLVRQPTPGWG